MNPTLKNILAVVIGLVVGSIVNGGVISISASIIPPPEGADLSTIEGLTAAQHLLEPRHYLMPFLAHALGALAGAFICVKIAASHQMKFAVGIGVFFLLGGITAAIYIPAPTWFIVADLALAYIPMAWIGGRLAGAK